MNNDLMKLLDTCESFEEGVDLIRINAESINEELAMAILEKSRDFKIGERGAWFKGWYKEAKGAAFLNTYSDFAVKDLEKANNLLLILLPEVARSAANIVLSRIEYLYGTLSKILSELDALAINLGVDAAQDKKKEFEEKNKLARGYTKIANILAEKSQDNNLSAEILLWEGLFDLLECDLSDTFGEKDKIKHLSQKAKSNFEKVLTLSTDFFTKIRCLGNLAKCCYQEDLNKSLNYLSQAKIELNQRKMLTKTKEDKDLIEELQFQTTKDLSHVLQKLNKFEDCYNILLPTIDTLEKKLWSLMAPNLIDDFLEKNHSFYLDMIKVCIELGKKDQEFNRKALKYAEMINARVFLEAWRTFGTFGTGVESKLLERRKELLENLRYLGWGASYEDLDELKKIQNEIGMVEQEIWKQSKIIAFFNEAKPATFNEIVRLVPKNGILIEYFVTSDKIFVFVVDDKDLLKIVEIKFERSELWQVIEMANLAIGCRLNYTEYNKLEKEDIHLPWTDLKNLNFLYKLLIEPVSSYLMDKELLYIIPHSELRKVPFQALYKELEDEKKYPIEEIAISYAPSASLLRLLKQRERSFKTCFSAGVPESKRGPKKALVEAQMVADFFNTKPMHGTREALSGANKYDVIHISCHSSPESVVSIFNGLMLEDGVLLPQDVRDLKCSLATLSACKTYSDDTSETRELAGLTGNFLKAGARSVVASLWPVHVDATYILMKEFYENLSQGENKAKALQKAQIKVKMEYSDHPLFWAPFFLVGTYD